MDIRPYVAYVSSMVEDHGFLEDSQPRIMAEADRSLDSHERGIEGTGWDHHLEEGGEQSEYDREACVASDGEDGEGGTVGQAAQRLQHPLLALLLHATQRSPTLPNHEGNRDETVRDGNVRREHTKSLRQGDLGSKGD